MKKSALLVILLFQTLALAQPQYTHPDYASGKIQVNEVVVVSLGRVVEFGLMSEKGKVKERETLQASDYTAGLVAKMLRDSNFTVHHADEYGDAAAKTTVNRLFNVYKKLIGQYLTAPFPMQHLKDLGESHIILATPAATLPGTVDALVFVRFVNKVTTGGRKFGSFQPDELLLDLAMVHASSGALLFYATATEHENLMKDQHKLHAALANAFASLPKAARREPKLAAQVNIEDPPASSPAKPVTVDDAETIHFAFDASDSTSWVEGNAEALATESLHEFVPKDEHVENWTRMVDWQASARAADPAITPLSFANGLRAGILRRCPRATWNVIEQTADQVIYEFKTGKCSPNPEQHEIGRVWNGPVNQYRLAYVRKTKELSPEERERWLKVLRGAMVVAKP